MKFPIIYLTTPCVVEGCGHPFNWHTADGCAADDGTTRCECIAFASSGV